jgi:hypothetical protein
MRHGNRYPGRGVLCGSAQRTAVLGFLCRKQGRPAEASNLAGQALELLGQGGDRRSRTPGTVAGASDPVTQSLAGLRADGAGRSGPRAW